MSSKQYVEEGQLQVSANIANISAYAEMNLIIYLH